MSGTKVLFTLRFWQERLTPSKSEWRGEIQAVGTNEVRYFRDWRTMVDFLVEVLSGLRGQRAVHVTSLSESGDHYSPANGLHRIPVRHLSHHSKIRRRSKKAAYRVWANPHSLSSGREEHRKAR
jgi:hypothetical protein